jgi:hypothetical protein
VILAGIDFCRPDDSKKLFLEDDLRDDASALPDLSDSDTEIESDSESIFQTPFDVGYMGSLIEDPVPGEEEYLMLNERNALLIPNPVSSVSLLAHRTILATCARLCAATRKRFGGYLE